MLSQKQGLPISSDAELKQRGMHLHNRNNKQVTGILRQALPVPGAVNNRPEQYPDKLKLASLPYSHTHNSNTGALNTTCIILTQDPLEAHAKPNSLHKGTICQC
jgi:hypothetical protein